MNVGFKHRNFTHPRKSLRLSLHQSQALRSMTAKRTNRNSTIFFKRCTNANSNQISYQSLDNFDQHIYNKATFRSTLAVSDLHLSLYYQRCSSQTKSIEQFSARTAVFKNESTARPFADHSRLSAKTIRPVRSAFRKCSAFTFVRSLSFPHSSHYHVFGE